MTQEATLLDEFFEEGVGCTFNQMNTSDKPLQEGYGVNVVYLTNKCNMACTYCYEDLADRPSQLQTKAKIKQHIDQILERESDPDQQTLILLFGGEATLEWENCKYVMTYAYSKKKNVHFQLTTNGIKFLSDKFLDQYANNWFQQRGFLSVDISFDGVGNKERIYHNGRQTATDVIKVFRKLNERGLQWRLRYTFHNLNIYSAYDDITRLAKLFKPHRIITSVAWDTLDKDMLKELIRVKDALRSDWINNIIDIPVCELFCDSCDGCGVRKETVQLYTDEGNVKGRQWNENDEAFDDFKPKRDEK
jgi:sulfatase maturation enzyme AslB (radical SAM superfamily)